MSAVRQKDFNKPEQHTALRDVPTAVSPLLAADWSAKGPQRDHTPDLHPDDVYDPEVDPWPVLVPSPILSDNWNRSEADDRMTGLVPPTLRPDMSTGPGAGAFRPGGQKVNADVYAQRAAIETQAGLGLQSLIEQPAAGIFARITLADLVQPTPPQLPAPQVQHRVKLLNTDG